MAGRYAGELFVRAEGDREAAPAYMPAARLLMGEVLEQAGFNALGSYKMTRQLRDGTVLVAEKIGELNRVTIAPPKHGGTKRPIRVFDDLVATAGVREWDDSGAVIYPPVILSHDREMRWKPYFASSQARGYSPGAGTYADAFTLADKNANSLRTGSSSYTNPDGVAVSWAGHPLFLAEPARNPNVSFGNAVFCLGKPLLYLQADAALQVGNYTSVLAAAIDDGYLMVLVAVLEPLIFDPRPATPERSYDAWASPIYSDTAHNTAMFRFKLVDAVDPVTRQSYYTLDYASEVMLWSGALVRGYNRWTFDSQQRAFVSVQLPESPTLLYRGSTVGDLGPSQFLSNNEVIFRVSASGLSTEPAGDVVFEAEGQQVRLDLDDTQADYVTPTRRIPALRRTHDATSDTRTYSVLLYADPVNDRYVLCHRRFVATATGGGTSATYTETSWYSVVDAGTDTPYGETYHQATGAVALDLYSAAVSVYLADLALAGSGIARICHSACGYIGQHSMMVVDNPLSTLWHSGYDVYGVRAGAMGYTDISLDIEGKSPEWGFTAYFGIGQDTGPQVDHGLSTVYTNWTATSSKHALAVHVPVSGSYLTSGDMAQLLNGAFDAHMFYLAPLGKSPNTQERERPQ